MNIRNIEYKFQYRKVTQHHLLDTIFLDIIFEVKEKVLFR